MSLALENNSMTAPLALSLEDIPLDTSLIEQSSLDLANRTRTNPFAWRGQFSPELVELLLVRFAAKDATVLDPYAGTGTTLIEAARRNLPALGVEINPAAVAMAETCAFVRQSMAERQETLTAASSLLDGIADESLPLLRRGAAGDVAVEKLLELIREHEDKRSLASVFVNVLIRALEFPSPLDADKLFRAFRQHRDVVLGLPVSESECRVINADARALPVESESVDLVVTSPPYINVFNYHQNNRRAMELLGWDLLTVARSEIGSNRKHRANRFMTVVQYCLDLALALGELKRVMKPEGRAIVIVGRESNVRGVSFPNGAILASVARTCGFAIPFRQERKFVSRFGTTVFEDILHLAPESGGQTREPVSVRRIGTSHLEAAKVSARDRTVLADIDDALSRAHSIGPSPVYSSAKARK